MVQRQVPGRRRRSKRSDRRVAVMSGQYFLREYDKLARQCAAEGVDNARYLLRLAELELIDRERRMVERRIKAARFPAVKSLDIFDFKAIPSLNKMLVLELARGCPRHVLDRHDLEPSLSRCRRLLQGRKNLLRIDLVTVDVELGEIKDHVLDILVLFQAGERHRAFRDHVLRLTQIRGQDLDTPGHRLCLGDGQECAVLALGVFLEVLDRTPWAAVATVEPQAQSRAQTIVVKRIKKLSYSDAFSNPARSARPIEHHSRPAG